MPFFIQIPQHGMSTASVTGFSKAFELRLNSFELTQIKCFFDFAINKPFEHLNLITKLICSLYFFHFVKEHSAQRTDDRGLRTDA